MKEDNEGKGRGNPVGDFICLLSLLTKIIAIKGTGVLTERKHEDEERHSEDRCSFGRNHREGQ